MNALRASLPSAFLIARREYLVRVRSRVFIGSTVLLAAVALAAGLAPAVIRFLDRDAVTRFAVTSPEAALQSEAVTVLDQVLNGAVSTGASGEKKPFVISAAADEALGRADVKAGRLQGLLIAKRGDTGAPSFTYVTRASPTGRQVALIRLSIVFIAASDRVGGLGEFGRLVTVEQADPDAPAPRPEVDATSRTILASVLVIVLFVTILTYGMWIATSVAEEKSSRVMEIMVSAASPGQMLSGKVAGVGAAGLTQYAVILAAGLLATQLQGPILAALFGPDGSGGSGVGGLSFPILAAFLTFFLLGFLLYAFLYAAAGSLVSRQEDIQMIAGPMLGLSIAGYFAASIAITSIDAPWVAPLSYVPFFSPWLMVARVTLSQVEWWEIGLAIGLLVVAIALSLVVAARVYRAGVLLYGQRPSLGALARVAMRGE